MKFSLRNPFCVFGLIVLWRIALLVLTVQPVPTNDGFFFDGAVVNWLRHGQYFNPSLSVVFPISAHQVYAAYPPLYQGALLLWMKLFGTTVVSAMALHVALFAISGFIALTIVRKYFPAPANHGLVSLLFLVVTFDDRPEGLAHMFGLWAMLLVGKMISGGANWRTATAITLALVGGFYTSVMVGAMYFGIGFIAVTVARLTRRENIYFAPFVLAGFFFWAIVFTIAKTEPLLWAGFLENARQTPIMVRGFRIPHLIDILKLVRNAPVFLIGVMALPFCYVRRREIVSAYGPWMALIAGVFVMGWALLAASMVLLEKTYVIYVVFTQILLAAGLLALAGIFVPAAKKSLNVALAGCVLLVSVRAVGMTTWGASCAWKNSYRQTHDTLLKEFAPFANTNSPVIASAAYLYTAAEANVQNPVQADWYFDRATWTNNADLNGFVGLQPRKLVLVQYDYYHMFAPLLERVCRQQGRAQITVRDLAEVRTPDSTSLYHVLQ